MKNIYRGLVWITIVVHLKSAKAQEPTAKYNKFLKITEYFDAEGQKIGFSRINTRQKCVDYYELSGKKIRSEALPEQRQEEVKLKPKKKLSDADMELITPVHYETIDGEQLIREPNPNHEHIGYYDTEGNLRAIKNYHRGTETWSMDWQ